MSPTAKQSWSVDSDTGNLRLEMSVEVNGRVAMASVDVDLDHQGSRPLKYIARELRNQMMAHIERELLGPRP